MSPRQWELSIVMIERCRFPHRVGMTQLTIMIEVRLDMIGAGNGCEIRLMTAITLFGCALECGRVAFAAAYIHMSAGQGKSSRVVAKAAGFPTRHVMTGRTGGVEIPQLMVGIGL